MRLNRLDLIRYGRFKDAAIAFPKAHPGQPDVTVIFGANEAGKSTAFHGYLELLFGFRAGAHPYAFRFDRSDLLLGAELDLPGRGATTLRRNSKRTQSLLDAQDRPLNEAILSSALHGLTRDSYEERFSLNDHGLRTGGERIAKAQGDLGQLLHAGLSGLTGMADTLESLSQRADRFHKKRGRGTVLKTGTERLREIGRALRADRLTAERERSLRRDRDRAAADFETAQAELQRAHQRQAACRAAQIWYDETRKIDACLQALADFPQGPDLPPDVPARVAALVVEIAAQGDRMNEASADIAHQTQVIADNPADDQAAPLAAELQRLEDLTMDGAPLIGRASTAQADLRRRCEERDGYARDIATVLAALGLPQAAAAPLALRKDALEDLAQAVQACLTAGLEAGAAQQAVDTARRQQGEAPPEPRDLTALQAAFDHWQGVADLTALKAHQAQALARLTKACAGLPAGWADLVAAGLPTPDTLDEAARHWASLTAELAAADQGLQARAAELTEAQAALSAHQAAPDAVDLARIEDTRRGRDRAWQRHRDGLTPDSADQFEAAMYADDSARAHYLTGAEARQRLAAAQGQAETARVRHETARKRRDALQAQQVGLAGRCAALAQALGVEPDAPPSAFAVRHQALMAAADAAADLKNAETALEHCRADQEAAHRRLSDAAQSVGLDPGPDLPDQVRRALTLQDSHRAGWAKWQDSVQALVALDRKAAELAAAAEQAHHRLGLLTAALPLPDRTPQAVHQALPHLRSLAAHHDAHQRLCTRVEALERAIADLATGAQRLAEIMQDGAAPVDRLTVVDRARARVDRARQADDKRTEALARREAAERTRQRAQSTRQRAEADLAACFAGQGGSDLDPRARVAQLAERDRLRAARKSAAQDRQAARDAVDPDLFAEESDRMPDATRLAVLGQALSDAQEARDAARDAKREAERLYRAAFEAADRSDLITEQATLLEDLRDGARQAAVARLGVLAARGALRRLAGERRNDMLRDVEQAFVTMTTPAWTGVDVWSQSEGDKLVGIQPDGSAVPVEHMSTGTMGQLYFALRLAGYRSFARAPGPLPMILDDIMETFDDTRARAALQLCAEIGTTGQAILFTHHAHLVSLARDTIPGVAVVNMPG